VRASSRSPARSSPSGRPRATTSSDDATADRRPRTGLLPRTGDSEQPASLASGDQALIRIGEILAAGVRDDDGIARIGGDEFRIVFPGAPLFAADRIMRRLARAIADATIPSGQQLPTIAWGIAPALVEGTSVDALVDAADRAMYRQKQLVRSRGLELDPYR
jgi:predicted signal transduction protein with EAL and GGDEF domain